jgi:DNA-binding response OmpR family regulator
MTRVLLFGDETAAAFAAALRERGFQVDTATDLDEAWFALGSEPAIAAVVADDRHAPDLKRLLEAGPSGIPLVPVSADAPNLDEVVAAIEACATES